MSKLETFLVPVDFSEHSRAALDFATQLARRLSANLHLVHVLQPPTYAAAYGAAVPPMIDLAQLREPIQRSLGEIVEELSDLPGTVTSEVVEGANIALSLQEAASKADADLIVMGTHGRTGLAHVFLGSVAERTLRHAPCPVLTVRGREMDDRD
jgi:nucleotide-binding universal stress UspA family protein